MGLIIISVLVGVIGLLLMHKIDDDFSNPYLITLGFTGLSFFVAAICAACVILTAITAPLDFPSYLYKAETYQSLVDNADPSAITDHNALYIEIVNFNKEILQYRRFANSFWTRGMVSSLWNDIPIVELHT